MAIFEWPRNSLPDPKTAFRSDIAPGTLRVVMDSGKVRQRQRFTVESSFYVVQWDLTDAQRALFKGIIKHKLVAGEEFFTIVLPVNNGLESVNARIIDGSYSEAYSRVFGWQVNVNMECFEVPTYTEDEVDTIIYADLIDGLEIATQEMYDLYNITIPLTLPK